MILCLDVGNTHLFGGVFSDEKLLLRFRCGVAAATSDEIGCFLRSVLRENELKWQDIKDIGMCSVVPQVDYSLRAACLKYFKREPFAIQAGIKTGLNIKYHNPSEVGADRIANAIAAVKLYPQKNIIVTDLGTATTFCAISKEKNYLGGTILPGLRLSMEALQAKTAKLPSVKIITPTHCLGRSTIDSIQSGLYYSHIGGIKEILQRLKKEAFNDEPCVVIGTGGFTALFDNANLFDCIAQDLVLKGIYQALLLNREGEQSTLTPP